MRPFSAIVSLILCSLVHTVNAVGDYQYDIEHEVSDSCMTSVQIPYLDCVMPLYRPFFGLTSHEIRRALIRMSLQELCGLLQAASRCVDELLTSSCSAEELAQNPALQSVGFYSPQAIDYVCVEHFDVFSEGKECLLSEHLGSHIRQHCYGFALTDSCPTEDDLTCAGQVLNGQCGELVAFHVTDLLRRHASSPQYCHLTNKRMNLFRGILQLA